MSRVKVNNINPLSGQNITLGGNAVPSGSDKNLGAEANPWAELYVSTGSVNFVGASSVTVASIKAGGETGLNPQIPSGMVFIETVGNFGSTYRGSFSVGRQNRATGTASLANGLSNTASGNYSYAQGQGNNVSGLGAHAQGQFTTASGQFSHAEGYQTLASGQYSHAEGYQTVASNGYAHTKGLQTLASGQYSHAEGDNTIASGSHSHAEGQGTTTNGNGAHAEGFYTRAFGDYSHAEGRQNLAFGPHSHAEGQGTTAIGFASHTEGLFTVASSSYQTVVGQYNALNNTASLFIVGAGITGTRQDGFSVELDTANAKPHIVLPTNTSNPTNPKTGSMYFNPSTNMINIWNGTTWRTASFG